MPAFDVVVAAKEDGTRSYLDVQVSPDACLLSLPPLGVKLLWVRVSY